MQILNKIKNQFGFDDDNYEVYHDEEIYDRDMVEAKKEETNVIKPGAFNKAKDERNQEITKISNNYTSPLYNIENKDSKQKISVVKPQKFEDAQKVAQEIIKGNIIVLNTSLLELRVAQRFLDFICGTAFAIEGEVTLVDEKIYLVSPNNIDVNDTISKGNTLKSLFSF